MLPALAKTRHVAGILKFVNLKSLFLLISLLVTSVVSFVDFFMMVYQLLLTSNCTKGRPISMY
jgi:hypothetical protein